MFADYLFVVVIVHRAFEDPLDAVRPPQVDLFDCEWLVAIYGRCGPALDGHCKTLTRASEPIDQTVPTLWPT
jgi:hypothetical protein